MLKRFLLAVLIIFVLWSVLDYVIHGLILASSYQATAHLWRPMEEMKMGLLRVTTLAIAALFVLTYVYLADRRTLTNALVYSLLFGLIGGLSMGLGSYSVMPVTPFIAWVWVIGSVVETVAGGLVMGLLLRK